MERMWKPVQMVTAAICVLTLSVPSAAAAMDVETLLKKAEALRRKGPAAPFSSDFRLVKSAIDDAKKRLEVERAERNAAGLEHTYCPTGAAELSRQEVLAAMYSVPTSDRSRTDIKAALRAAYAKKYPCTHSHSDPRDKG